MTYRGHVKGGVVVFDESVPLPEGAEVEVTARTAGVGDQASLVDRGRELVRRTRERNRNVSPETIEREVERAVDEVRGRARP